MVAEKDESQLTVPYIAYESAQAKSERAIKRLTIAVIVISLIAVIAVFSTAYFIDKNWRDYISNCAIENYSVSTDGGGDANYIGQDGDINNGKD